MSQDLVELDRHFRQLIPDCFGASLALSVLYRVRGSRRNNFGQRCEAGRHSAFISHDANSTSLVSVMKYTSSSWFTNGLDHLLIVLVFLLRLLVHSVTLWHVAMRNWRAELPM